MTDTTIYLIGITGNLLFAIKSLPQVIKCHKTKTTKNISTTMILTDFLGNIFCSIFIFNTTGFTLWPQFVNYTLATLWLIILITFKFTYKNSLTQ